MTQRLDVALTSKKLFSSREKAQAAIRDGQIYVNGILAEKPGISVPEDASLEVRGQLCPYVSRGGWKLEKALREFSIDPTGWICGDAGASTGGFTDCLLQHGAARVYAIDVGEAQLDESLRKNPRVCCREKTNLRYLTLPDLGEPLDLFTLDVSFISLGLVLPAVSALLKAKGLAICLIKPQFEAGRALVGKKGVVKDPRVHLQVLQSFAERAQALDFGVRALSFSPIRGPEGNIEFLGCLTKGGNETAALDLAGLVKQANLALKG